MLSFVSLKEILSQFGFKQIKTIYQNRCFCFYNQKYGKDFHINVYLDIVDHNFVEEVVWVNENDWEGDIYLFDVDYRSFPEKQSLVLVESQLERLTRRPSDVK